MTVEEIDNDEANFIKLEKGRIDGVITNYEVGYAIISPSQLDSIIAIELAIQKVPTYVVFNKEKQLFTELAAFNRAIKEIAIDGTGRKIRDEYIRFSSTPRQLDIVNSPTLH